MAKEGDPRRSGEWQVLRRQCYERDKARRAVCWICKQPIDYSARPSSTPDSYEPDHRFDVHRHPELALCPENVRPSHKHCNRSRKDRAVMDDLGTPSRDW